MMASCSSDSDVIAGADGPDAAHTDASAAPDVAELHDGGGVIDAGPSRPDAATSDAGPRPVVCASASCATSLVTTLGLHDREGYCALLHDGTVACWGQNQDGQLGRGEAGYGVANSAIATRVEGLSNVVALDHTCAIDEDGATWCWGKGPFLRSTSSFTNEHTPVKLPIPPATRVAVHNSPLGFFLDTGVACAAVDDGLLCWGRNGFGQIAPFDRPPGNELLAPQPVAIPQGAKIRSIHLGMASFLLREDGTLLSWGMNPTIGRVSSLFPDPYPRAVALTGVSSVDVLEGAACAVAEGIAYCWRAPAEPMFIIDGDPVPEESFIEHALPERIPTPEPVVQISTTSRTNARGCATGVSGDVYCWGKNTNGVLGDRTTKDAPLPVKVVGLPGPAVEVRTLDTSTCALLTTGKVHCWGGDRFGQLGGGHKNPTLVPREVVLP